MDQDFGIRQSVGVPKNSKRGVSVRDDDIKAAFEFIDVERKGVITASSLRKRLGAFNRALSTREARVLMNNKPEMTLDELREMLLDNEVTNFDPVAEAFKVYDPEGTGFMDAEVLRKIFDNLGFGLMSDEELALLVEAADGDGDGRVSVEDFRGICDPPDQQKGDCTTDRASEEEAPTKDPR